MSFALSSLSCFTVGYLDQFTRTLIHSFFGRIKDKPFTLRLKNLYVHNFLFTARSQESNATNQTNVTNRLSLSLSCCSAKRLRLEPTTDYWASVNSLSLSLKEFSLCSFCCFSPTVHAVPFYSFYPSPPPSPSLSLPIQDPASPDSQKQKKREHKTNPNSRTHQATSSFAVLRGYSFPLSVTEYGVSPHEN